MPDKKTNPANICEEFFTSYQVLELVDLHCI